MNIDPQSSRPPKTQNPWYWIGFGIASLIAAVFMLFEPEIFGGSPGLDLNRWVMLVPYFLANILGKTPTVMLLLVLGILLIGQGVRLWRRSGR